MILSKKICLYFSLICLFLFKSATIKGQDSLSLNVDNVKLELVILKHEQHIIVKAKINNLSERNIFINPYGISEKYIILNNILNINYGAMINSLLHPYLPLEADVILNKVNPGDRFAFEDITIPNSRNYNTIKIGLDFLNKKRSKIKKNKDMLYSIKPSLYKQLKTFINITVPK